MSEHFDLREVEVSRYSVEEVTLPLYSEPCGDGALKVICPGCLESWRIPAPDSDDDDAHNYRCRSPCESVIRVV